MKAGELFDLTGQVALVTGASSGLGGDDMVHRALGHLPGGAAGAILVVMVAMFLLGWGIFLANPVSLLVIPCFVLCMTRFQIIPEEKALQSLFGSDFQAYRAKVRRWL